MPSLCLLQVGHYWQLGYLYHVQDIAYLIRLSRQMQTPIIKPNHPFKCFPTFQLLFCNIFFGDHVFILPCIPMLECATGVLLYVTDSDVSSALDDMEQARKRLSLALVLEDENADSNDEENADYEYSLFNYKPKFCDMKSPLSASNLSKNVINFKSRSSSTLLSNSFTSLASSFVDVEELENYVIPRDVKKLSRSRTKSFSPGSAVTKYDMIKQKYQFRQNNVSNQSRYNVEIKSS